MKFNKKLLAAALVTAGGFAAISSANASSHPVAEDTFTVNMTVEKICTVVAGGDITIAAVKANNSALQLGQTGSTFNVACSVDTPYNVSMIPTATTVPEGETALGESMGTLRSTGITDTLAYQLSVASGGTPWAAGVAGSANTTTGGVGTGTGANKEFIVYAEVKGGTANVRPAVYTDTVTIRVNY